MAETPNVVKPQVGPNQGHVTPAKAPNDTKPSTPGHSPGDRTSGTPAFLAKGVPVSDILNNEDEGYIGVDPIYQNGASANERPVVEDEG